MFYFYVDILISDLRILLVLSWSPIIDIPLYVPYILLFFQWVVWVLYSQWGITLISCCNHLYCRNIFFIFSRHTACTGCFISLEILDSFGNVSNAVFINILFCSFPLPITFASMIDRDILLIVSWILARFDDIWGLL